MRIIASVVFAIMASVSGNDQDPCVNHMTLNVTDRDVSGPNFVRVCDRQIPGWYRVYGPGNVDMDISTRERHENDCNTVYPVWFKGNLSTIAELHGTACQSAFGHTCFNSVPISIKPCGIFRVYLLENLFHSIGCPSAFCWDQSESPDLEECSGDAVVVNGRPSVRASVGDSDRRLLKYIVEELRFTCHLVNANESVYYDIKWYINGHQLAFESTSVNGGELENNPLAEAYWKRTYKLGMFVKCSIAAKTDPRCQPGPTSDSESFFAGIIVSDFDATIQETEAFVIHFQSTIPIPYIHLPGQQSNETLVLFYVSSTFGLGSCRTVNRPVVTDCGFKLSSYNWTAKQSLKTYGVRNSQYDTPKIAQLHIISSRQHLDLQSIWDNINLPQITINVLDKDTEIRGKRCHSHNDPHWRTFDNVFYENQREGEFVMFRHKTLPYAVHSFHQRCNSMATCNCGVAIQSGRDILIFDRCKRNSEPYVPSRIRGRGCNTDGFKVIKNDRTYGVLLPTGMKVEVNLGGARFLNIDIIPSPVDIQQTEGLCGTLNNEKCDEFMKGNKQILSSCPWDYQTTPTDFVEQYFVNGSDSLFKGNLYNNWALESTFCTCKEQSTAPSGDVYPEAECSNAPPSANCIVRGVDATDLFTTTCKQKRKKREQQPIPQEDDEFDDIDYDPTFQPPEPKWRNGWTNETALSFCTNYTRSSRAFQLCKDVPDIDASSTIQTCVQDIKLSGGSGWARTALENYKGECYQEVSRITEFPSSDNDTVSLLEVLDQNLCLNECNDRGTCINGSCQCEEGYYGTDCAVDMSKPPEHIMLPKKGRCDVQTNPCRATKVYGDNFFDTEDLICRSREIKVNKHGYEATGIVEEGKAEYVHEGEVVCNLEAHRRKRSSLLDKHNAVTGYAISISNTGGLFGGEVIFVPYDSTCSTCSVVGDTATCVIQAGFCVNDNRCSLCEPTMETTSSTSASATPQDVKHDEDSGATVVLDEDSTPTVVLAVVIPSLLVAGIAICIVVKKKGQKGRDATKGSQGRIGISLNSLGNDSWTSRSMSNIDLGHFWKGSPPTANFEPVYCNVDSIPPPLQQSPIQAPFETENLFVRRKYFSEH